MKRAPITPEEERRAYEVLARRFGVPADDIKHLLEDHFECMPQRTQVRARAEVYADWTLDKLRQFFEDIDEQRRLGLLPPLMRYIDMDRIKRDTRGKYYIASDEQLQQEMELQSRLSIDPDGNLVMKDGQVKKYRWLQSFETKE